MSLVSLILCVKNGMPFLPHALASVAAQTYRDFELIVQDACSTDGSLGVIRTFQNLPRVDVVSETDGGIGEAYNRARHRCRGEIVGTIDADNLLDPAALARVVQILQHSPHLAAVYGSANLIDHQGKLLDCFQPAEFDALCLMRCELVPPFASSFFFVAACGRELYFDQSLRTCADFDLWLRLSHLPILRANAIFGSTRLSNKSMSRDAERYESYCDDKLRAVSNHFRRINANGLTQSLLASARAGIYAWAAESVFTIEGESERFEQFFRRAAKVEPGSLRLQNLRRKIEIEGLKKTLAQRVEEKGLALRWVDELRQKVMLLEKQNADLGSRIQIAENSRLWRLSQRYEKVQRRLRTAFRGESSPK